MFHSDYKMIRFLDGYRVVELIVMPEVSPGFRQRLCTCWVFCRWCASGWHLVTRQWWPNVHSRAMKVWGSTEFEVSCFKVLTADLPELAVNKLGIYPCCFYCLQSLAFQSGLWPDGHEKTQSDHLKQPQEMLWEQLQAWWEGSLWYYFRCMPP